MFAGETGDTRDELRAVEKTHMMHTHFCFAGSNHHIKERPGCRSNETQTFKRYGEEKSKSTPLI